MTLEMARLVGPQVKAVGIDMDAEKLCLAEEDAEREHIANVELRVGDAASLDEVASYGLVYTNLLLIHLPEPRLAVERMVRVTRPDGQERPAQACLRLGVEIHVR